jgi:C4-dicarboxylate-specific signal transduction histidine kinase
MADHSLNIRVANGSPKTSNLSLCEEQPRQANKIAVLGQLAAGIVHDFNHVHGTQTTITMAETRQ